MTDWFVYIVRCSDGSLYTGISNNVSKRVDRHNAGKGAKYTSTRRPVKLIRTESFVSENEARKRESQIKGWVKVKKENLIKFGHPNGSQ